MSSTEKALIKTTTASTAIDETDYSDEYEEVSTVSSIVKAPTEAEKERIIVPLEVIPNSYKPIISYNHTVLGLTVIFNNTNNYTDNQTNHYDRIH